MARQAKNQRSTCHMAKDCSETGWGGTSLVVNATNQPLQHQTAQAEASQVSARLGFEQSSVAGMVFPPAGACDALAEVSMCGLASTTNAWHIKNSSQTARLVLCPQLPTPKGNALPPPRQLQLPGKELARKKEAHKELGITNCSPQDKRKVLAHHREAHGIALAIIHNQSNIKNKIKAKPGKSWLRTTSLFQNTAHKNPGSLIKLCLGGRKHSSTKPAVCFVNRQKRTGV